jgi:RNA polymerase sigma factor (TIGR02999 family)
MVFPLSGLVYDGKRRSPPGARGSQENNREKERTMKAADETCGRQDAELSAEPSTPGDITQLLRQAETGDVAAANRLFLLVQDDLKAIAKKIKGRGLAQPGGLDEPTTALVDDAFCRLVGRREIQWQPGDRRKFYGFMANKIHDLLIQAARAHGTAKRGGGQQPARAESVDIADPHRGEDADVLLDLRTALDQLRQFAAADALVFQVRYFFRCTFEESAAVVGISATEAHRAFERARLWLQLRLKEYAHDS